MIYTHAHAKATLTQALGGPSPWHWAELGIHAPYYLLDVEVETEDGPFIRHIITAEMKTVLHTFRTDDKRMKLRNVGLLSPRYLNGSETYQLKSLSQIWSADKAGHLDLLFVHADGTRIRFCLSGDTGDDTRGMTLLADFRHLRNREPDL